MLQILNTENKPLGTGFVVGPNRVLTASHVVSEQVISDKLKGSSSPVLLKTSEGKTLSATLEKVDTDSDLALLKTSVRFNKFLSLKPSGFLNEGDPVVIPGFPLGQSFTVTGGMF